MATEPSCEYALYFRIIFFLMQVKSLPWNEDTIAAETSLIQENLVFLNSKGILTINSQPHVNGAPSTDSTHGWGGSGGYIYQKVSKQNTTTNSSPTVFTVSPCYHKIAMHHCISIVKLCINERTALNRYYKYQKSMHAALFLFLSSAPHTLPFVLHEFLILLHTLSFSS